MVDSSAEGHVPVAATPKPSRGAASSMSEPTARSLQSPTSSNRRSPVVVWFYLLLLSAVLLAVSVVWAGGPRAVLDAFGVSALLAGAPPADGRGAHATSSGSVLILSSSPSAADGSATVVGSLEGSGGSLPDGVAYGGRIVAEGTVSRSESVSASGTPLVLLQLTGAGSLPATGSVIYLSKQGDSTYWFVAEFAKQ